MMKDFCSLVFWVFFLRFCGFCCHFWCKAESLRFEANLSHDSESMALVVGPRWQQRGRMGRIRSGGKAPELSWRLARRLALLWSGEDDVIVESVNIWCLYIMWCYVMLCVLFFRNWKVWNLNSKRCNESVEDISGSISFGSSLEPEKTRFHVFFLIRNRGSTKANWTPRPLPSPEPNRKRDGRSPENGWDDLMTRLARWLSILKSMTSYDMTWWVSWTHYEVLVNSESWPFWPFWPFWPSWPSWQTSGCPPSKVGLMQSLEVFEQLLQF